MLSFMTASAGSGDRRSSGWRRWARRLAALFAGLLVALVCAEVAVRVLDLHVARRSGQTARLLTRVQDPALGFRLTPGTPAQIYRNADGTETRVTYTINPDGYRGKRLREEKPSGTTRVAVLGDSFVFGTGVGDEGTLPRTLERFFDRSSPPDGRVQVLNFGVPGYGVEQLLVRLQRDALRYDPDVVLAVLYINDAVASEATGSGRERTRVEATLRTPQMDWIDRLGLTSNLTDETEHAPRAQRWMIALRQRSRLADLLADRLFLSLFSAHTLRIYEHSWRVDGPGWARVLEVLRKLKQHGGARGFELHVALYPLLEDLSDYPYREIHARLASACEGLDVPFHDLLEPLDGRDARSLWAHIHDHHPNAACNTIVGSWLADRMSGSLHGSELVSNAPDDD